MALSFHPLRRAIEMALDQLKSDGQVHPDAAFNYDAPDGLRSEVTYRDLDFGHRLGRTALEVEVVDAALDSLNCTASLPPMHRTTAQPSKRSAAT
jgi:hypothetical protein